jgi:hypothetical protein
MSMENNPVSAGTAYGFLDREVDSEHLYHPRLIANRGW